MRSLVLSGGAFRGAAQLPVIERLMQQHEYNYIYGVSVGAINGAMVAQEKVLELRRMWENIDSIGGFLKLKWYWRCKGLCKDHVLLRWWGRMSHNKSLTEQMGGYQG